MSKRFFSLRWCLILALLLAEFVLSAPQGYNYYSNQQRTYAQRAQAQRLQAQRFQAQNRYQQSYRPSRNSYKKSINRADAENGKFLGLKNQESEENARTLNLIRRKKQLLAGNPCYFRNAGQPEGRFLWDVNVYNIYSGGGGGGGCGSANYGNRPFGGFFQNFLSLFIPGGALNPNVRPFQSPIQSDSTGAGGLPAGVQNDASIDPNLDSSGTGVSTASIGSTLPINGGVGVAPMLTPGQIIGSAATTVNSVIQTLTGNVRPVYRNYG